MKLFADMEMYFGACERITYYIESGYHEQQNPTESCKYENLTPRDRTMEAFT